MTQTDYLNAAVPTSADTFTNIGTFTVPAGAARITQLKFGVVPDHGTAAISIRNAPILRLRGSGLLEQDPHQYVGNCGGVSIVTTGGASGNNFTAEYTVDIPVAVGGTFTADIDSVGEAQTAGTMFCNVFYESDAPKLGNNMADVVSVAGATTADAFTTVGTFTIPQGAGGKIPKSIAQVVIGIGLDQGTSAVSLRSAPVIRLTGSGLAVQGQMLFTGPTAFSGEIGSSASQGVQHQNITAVHNVNIPVNAGGTILAEHKFITETPTASSVLVGLVYNG